MANWHFEPLRTGYQPVREPIQGEFFSAEAIDEPYRALVRESIQNALDAGLSNQQVHVRIEFSEIATSRMRQDSAFGEAMWLHANAKGNGLRVDTLPNSDEPCQYLLVEDFGTRGLEGDPLAVMPPSPDDNGDFYYFFRSEGRSGKSEKMRGSWGVGKHVFPRASRISAFFGLTVRSGDRSRLLMGRAIYKSHTINGQLFQDGYFGVEKADRIGPVVDQSRIDRFVDLFMISRKDEPGLSVVVPYLHNENNSRGKDLLYAVLQDYFYPILQGGLKVTLVAPDIRVELDRESVLACIQLLDPEKKQRLVDIVDLASWSLKAENDHHFLLLMPNPTKAWAWARELIPDSDRIELQDHLREARPLRIRVPVTIRKKGEQPAVSHFDILVRNSGSTTEGSPIFIREGITIPAVNGRRARGVDSIVIVEDGPLASFLRDAENPSHTEWQHMGAQFQGKYPGGKTCLDFVRHSVHDVLRFLADGDDVQDKRLLVDFFSLPSDDPDSDSVEGSAPKAEQPGKEGNIPNPVKLHGGRHPSLSITPINGGFRVTAGSVPPPMNSTIRIMVAYDRRRGNPLRKYDPLDFQFGRKPVAAEIGSGLENLVIDGNSLTAVVKRPDFSLRATGFDKRRDLYIDATCISGDD